MRRRDLAKKYFGDVPVFHHGNQGIVNLIERVLKDITDKQTLKILKDIKEVLKSDDVKKQEFVLKLNIEAACRALGQHQTKEN